MGGFFHVHATILKWWPHCPNQCSTFPAENEWPFSTFCFDFGDCNEWPLRAWTDSSTHTSQCRLMADRGPTALLDDRLRPLKNGCSYGKFWGRAVHLCWFLSHRKVASSV